MEENRQQDEQQHSDVLEAPKIEADSQSMEPSIITPAQSTENSPPTPQSVPTGTADGSPASFPEDRSTPTPDQQQTQPSSKSSTPAPAPAPAPQLKRRPRRTGQPLHLLLQDCSKQASSMRVPMLDSYDMNSKTTYLIPLLLNCVKQHIMGYLCKKTPEEITAIISDKRLLAADLRNYSNEFVLTSARDRVIGEVDEEGKELLKDVDPERDVIKQRFEDETSVFKGYDDAIHDIRVDLFLDGIKPRKQEEVEEDTDTTALIAELNAVLQVWDTLYKRIEVEPRRGGRATQGPYPNRGGKPVGPPGTRSHPYAAGRYPAASPPHFGPPFAGSPHHNAPPYPRGHRDYHERPPYRDEYFPDRRDDYRRPDYDRRDPRDHPVGMRGHGPIPLGRPDSRDMRDTRDHRDFRDWS
ncbi:hypothetical protein BG011_000599, partial [Mortierella polycephala]